MPCAKSRRRSFLEQSGAARPTNVDRADSDDFQQIVGGALDQIPQLMHKLSNSSLLGDFGSGYQYQCPTANERRRKKSYEAAAGYDATANKTAASPTHRDSPCDVYGTSPPAPPPRALELVKEEVHRALQAFSTRPLKGEPRPPLPSDLLRPFDVSRDGRVTYPEFKAGLRGLGLGLTADETEALARDVDCEGTGLVSREKFETAAIKSWGGAPTIVASSREITQRPTGDGVACEQYSLSHDGDVTSGRGEEQQTEHLSTADNIMRDEHYARKQDGSSRRSATVKKNVYNSAPGKRWSDRDSCKSEDGTVSFTSFIKNRTTEGEPAHGLRPRPPESRTQKAQVSRSQSRGKQRSPTVSFDYWRQMTTGGDSDDGAAASIAGSCGRIRHENARKNRWLSRKRHHSINTLRSLVQDDDCDNEATADGANNHPQSSGNQDHAQRLKRQQRYLQRYTEEQQAPSVAAGGGGGRRGGADRGRSLVRKERRGVRPSSAPAGAEPRRGREKDSASKKAKNVSVSSQKFEKACKAAARAESVLRLRSRGDLVGLRKALSRADPSASGVISRREMERVILRRFGTGLCNDEARELSALYRKECNGRTMVDYSRLMDNLEAEEAGIWGQEVVGCNKPHPKEKGKRKNRTSRTSQPEAAGAPSRDSHGRYCRIIREDGIDWAISDTSVEESQLVRRARAKTLALLNRHGTRSVDCVFRLVDPEHSERFTAKQLREGLQILGGTDPLSDVEHRALFRDVSRGKERVKYRELLDTLQIAEARENRERTQRKLAWQADLPTSGRGSASHLRHSNVLDWHAPAVNAASLHGGLSRGRQHKEARQHALVFQRLRDSVRKIQDDCGSAGPVFDMFRREGAGGAPATKETKHSNYTTSSLSPSELRTGLGSLGVPLGDEDFVNLIASTDPDRLGEVSYPMFCKALRLHQLHDSFNSNELRAATFATQRPSSAPQLLSSQSIGQGVAAGHANGTKGRRGGGGGSARRKAMDLAPADDMNLDGGVFHRNSATDGCANPNFTTTMIPASRRGGRHGATEVETHRPMRRPSPGPSVTLHHTGVWPRSQRQTLLVSGGDDQSQLWNDTGATAEKTFRHGLGIKTRRPRSHSYFSHGEGGGGRFEGWDNMGTPSPRGGPLTIDGFGTKCRDTATIASGGNRRGRTHAPMDSDLGFGSKRMRSELRCDDRRARSVNSGRRSSGTTSSAGSRRQRSQSLGADRRYGDWTRSSVQYLLQHGSCVGVRSDPLVKSTSTIAGYSSDRGKVENASTMHMSRNTFSASEGGYPNSCFRSSRHPAQVTQRRAAPYATDSDVFRFRQRSVRSGSGNGDKSNHGSGGTENSRRSGRTATATDRRAVPADTVARRYDTTTRTRDLGRRASEVDVLGLEIVDRADSSAGGGRRRGRSAQSATGPWRHSDESRDWSTGEYAGGQFSPTPRWDDSSLPTGRESGQGRVSSTEFNGREGRPAARKEHNIWHRKRS